MAISSIEQKGSYYELYDERGKKYETIHHSKGDFVSITGDTFILRHGSYNDTYDKWGDKVSSRHA